MAEPIPRPRIGSRKNGRIGSRKSGRRIPKGIIHIQADFNNTIVTVTDIRGRVISWSSAGTYGFRGPRRGTPFAAETASKHDIRKLVDRGIQQAEVRVKGPGLGREATVRAIGVSGIKFISIKDLTLSRTMGVDLLKKDHIETKIEHL